MTFFPSAALKLFVVYRVRPLTTCDKTEGNNEIFQCLWSLNFNLITTKLSVKFVIIFLIFNFLIFKNLW